MHPRITISRTKNGELEVWLNPAGRDLLVRELQLLSEKNDHFHFMPEEMGGEVPVRNRPYGDGDEIIDWAKVTHHRRRTAADQVGRHRVRQRRLPGVVPAKGRSGSCYASSWSPPC